MGTVGYLLDTHTLLWALRGHQNLSTIAADIIASNNTLKLVSAVSAYEIMYKHKLGKLSEYSAVAENYFGVLELFGAKRLPITEQHTHYAGTLEWEHRDPFDRLLVAQAFKDNLSLITNDPEIRKLQLVSVVW